MTKNKNAIKIGILAGIIGFILTFLFVKIDLLNYLKSTEEITPNGAIIEDWQLSKIAPTKEMVGNIVLYANSRWGAIYEKSEEGVKIASLLIHKLCELNLQARCIVSEKDLQGMKKKNKIIELVFKKPVDITISQWIELKERSHIPVDEKGYRILEDVETTLFILEDNLDEGLEAHILIGHGIERTGYSCWAIKQEDSNKLDKSWIEEINKLIK